MYTEYIQVYMGAVLCIIELVSYMYLPGLLLSLTGTPICACTIVSAPSKRKNDYESYAHLCREEA